jgi:hypothetical protein
MIGYLVSPHAASATVDGGAVLLHMETKRYYSLNETGASIWRMLQRRLEAPEIVRELMRTYQVGIADAERALTRLLEELREEALITEVGE